MTPVVLDFDSSVLPLDRKETRLPLADWQEAIRFGCSWRDYRALEKELSLRMPHDYGCVFTGSGDYHHLSLYLLRRLAERKTLPSSSLDVVVCDNHPDNMRYPFGLHCGSWVRHAAALPFVRHMHVIGITSRDIGLGHAWETYLSPFLERKLTYWSIGVHAGWLSMLGGGDHARSFDTPEDLLRSLQPCLETASRLYLSIDKDVLSPDVVRTNWDQGVFEPDHLKTVIDACAGRLEGTDICGDVSEYRYAGLFKRLLSRLDGQESLSLEDARLWQNEQRAISRRLLDWIDSALI